MVAALHVAKAFLTTTDLRRIVQSCVFSADIVYLPSTVQIATSLDEAERKYASSRLLGLHDLRAVQFWAVDGPSQYIAQVTGMAPIVAPDIVLTLEDYMALYGAAEEQLIHERHKFLDINRGQAVDGMTEMVLGKHILWNFALQRRLAADDIMLDRGWSSSMSYFFNALLARRQMVDDVLSEVVRGLRIPDLTLLDFPQIERCRQFMPAFRAQVTAKLEDSGLETAYDSRDYSRLVREVADAVIREFYDYLMARARQPRFPFLRGVQNALWRFAEVIPSAKLNSEEQHNVISVLSNGTEAAPPHLFLMELMSRSASSTAR